MQNNINKNGFYKIESLFHELHPITKILCTIIYFIILLFSKSIYLNLILLVLLLINMVASYVPFKYYFKVLKRLLLLLIFIFIFNFIIKMNLTRNVIVVLKVLAFIMFNCTLVFTTKPEHLVKNMGTIIKPLKYIGIPIYKISFAIVYFLNSVFRLFDLKDNIKRKNKKNLISSNMIMPLFVINKRNKKMLNNTMKIKFYDVNKTDLEYMKLKYQFADIMLIILYVVILILMFEEEVFLCVI